MRRRDFLKASTPLLVLPTMMSCRSLAQTSSAPPELPARGADGWASLINGRDLSGWYTMLQKSGKGVAEKREDRSDGRADE